MKNSGVFHVLSLSCTASVFGKMDCIVESCGGVGDVEIQDAKQAKPIKSASIDAGSSKVKSRSSSNESLYEIVSEIVFEESDNDECNGDIEKNSNSNKKAEFKQSVSTDTIKQTPLDDSSDNIAMDEEFVIVDDDVNDVPEEKTNCTQTTPDTKKDALSDVDDFEMDEIIAEFAKEEGKKSNVVKLSEDEDELDELLEEFVETQSSFDEKKTEVNVILSSDGEDDMDCLLEEFSKENMSDDDSIVSKEKMPLERPSHAVNSNQNSLNVSSASESKSLENCGKIVRESSSDTNAAQPSNSTEGQSRKSTKCAQDSSHGANTIVKSDSRSESDCVIVCDTDDRTNGSDSSVEILNLDDITVNESDLNVIYKGKEKVSSNVDTSVKSDPSPDETEQDDLDNMILEIEEEEMENTADEVELNKAENLDTDNQNTNVEESKSAEKSDELPKDSSLVNSSTNPISNDMIMEHSELQSSNDRATEIAPKDCETSPEMAEVETPTQDKVGILTVDKQKEDIPTETSEGDKMQITKDDTSVQIPLLNINSLDKKTDDVEAVSSDITTKISVEKEIDAIGILPKETDEISITLKEAGEISFPLKATDGTSIPSKASDGTSIPSKASDGTSIPSKETVETSMSSKETDDTSILSKEIVETSISSKETVETSISLKETTVNCTDSTDSRSNDLKVTEVQTEEAKSSFKSEDKNSLELKTNATVDDDDDIEILELPSDSDNIKNKTEESKTDDDIIIESVSDSKTKGDLKCDKEDGLGDSVKTDNSSLPREKLQQKTEEINIISEKPSNNEIKPVSEDTKKRKLESDTEIDAKKLKIDSTVPVNNFLNGEESSTSGDFALKNTNIEQLVSDVSVADCKAIDKVNEILPLIPSNKFEATKKVLDKIALLLCQEVIIESFKQPYDERKTAVKELESKLEALTKNVETFNSQAAEFVTCQKASFQAERFNPKVTTRTVGVNVKIYRESELKQALLLQNAANNKTTGPQTEKSATKQETASAPATPVTAPKIEPQPMIPSGKIRESVMSNAAPQQVKETIISNVSPQQTLVRRAQLPRIITQSNRPLVGPQAVTALTSRGPPPPNVTMSGNRLIPYVNTSNPPPSTHSLMLVSSNSVTAPMRNNHYIDLTKDERPLGKIPPTGIGSKSSAVAIQPSLQLLQPGSKSSAVAIQPSLLRPAIIPAVPPGLQGARTYTYFVPQNSGIGRGVPVVQSPNQQYQVFFQVTRPASGPAVGTLVNSLPRMSGIPQQHITGVQRMAVRQTAIVNPTITRMPATSQASGNLNRPPSGFVVLSHQPRHPAPFPKAPVYDDMKGKDLPPKPSLKGNRNPTGGIVLSWNMNILKTHTQIASYQLFAYQETDGPVDASLWKKVGDVNALPLPMACTLTQFVDKNRYYFTVRAVDIHQRVGPYSDPVSVLYEKDIDSIKN